MPEETRGACHCGLIAWKFNRPAKSIVKCHCGNCRKLQGSDYSTWVVVEAECFRLERGEEFLSKYEVGKSSRSFCSKCGTTVFLINGKHLPTDVVIPLGAIEHFDVSLSPQVNVYTGDKAEWVEISDTETVLS